MKKALITLTLSLFAAALFAQGSDDACLFSQTYYQGTAKALGMGNALAAVGGDFTGLCINPAGMGLYRSDEFTMTLNGAENHQASTYYGTNASSDRWSFSMPNIGYVHATQKSNFKPLRYTQFCIGMTRTNDYNMHTYASGLNPTSSRIDDYLMQIDGYAVDELSEYFGYTVFPAWQTYLIDIDGQGYYSSPVPQGGVMQSLDQDFKGRSEEWTFGYSANFNDRFFIGATAAIPYLKRVGSRVYAETMPEGSDIQTDFNEWSFTEELSSYGVGINGKIGLLWIANRWLRLGAAYHTRSLYSFDESWQTQTMSKINYVTRKYTSLQSNYEYNFLSPRKWVVGAAFVVGEKGMVSLDADYVNYGAAEFSADDYDYSSVNQDIKDTYARTLNFRIGTEWRINDSYLRLGAGYYGSPFGLGVPQGSVKKASVGISLPAGDDTTFDLAYELTHGKQSYTLYDAGALGIEAVAQRQWRSVAIATLKVRF